MRVDPNNSGARGGIPKPGRKVAHAVGYDRWTAQSGRPMITVSFVVVNDLEDNGDEGCTFDERFTISERAVWRVGAWAQATGVTEPFDTDDNDAIERIIAYGPVVVDLVEDEYNGNVRIVPAMRGYSRFTGENLPEWQGMIADAEQAFQKRIASRESFGSSGGASRPTSRPAAQRASADDIPF